MNTQRFKYSMQYIHIVDFRFLKSKHLDQIITHVNFSDSMEIHKEKRMITSKSSKDQKLWMHIRKEKTFKRKLKNMKNVNLFNP